MNGVQIVRQAGETQLVFDPALDVAHARDLYRELDEVLAAHQPLALDASHVERIDAATLQLLAAFCCAARDAGVPLRWAATSEVLRSAATLLDLNDTLGRPT